MAFGSARDSSGKPAKRRMTNGESKAARLRRRCGLGADSPTRRDAPQMLFSGKEKPGFVASIICPYFVLL
jgi:hypothetical protein